MDEIVKDERFKHIAKDYRFKMMPKSERKFKIDKRFKNMFHDKKFKLKYTVDKRGRPTNLTTNDNLKKYYQLSSDSEAEDENEEDEQSEKHKGPKKEKNKPKKGTLEEKKSDEEAASSENEEKIEARLKIDKKISDVGKKDEDEDEDEYESEDSADEKNTKEDDEDDDDDDDDEDDSSANEEEVEIPWNELDRDTVRDDNISARLAICNMDWDRIKAVDLFVMLNSFKPAQGVIKSVKIYLSEYGKERMDYEKSHGPKELTESQDGNLTGPNFNDDDDNDSTELNESEDEEGNTYDKRKLRVYQFNRLRYFYALVECDTAETANKIYTECDGMEYESSCNRLDLRFVPDDMEFDEKDVRETCTEAPDPITYKPNLFSTTALNQTRVECTWDETPRDRLAITMRKYTEEDLKNSDFKNILATSSSEEEEDEADEENKKEVEVKGKAKKESLVKNKAETNKKSNTDPEEEKIMKYRELLLGADKKKSFKDREGDLEISWEGGMEEEGFNDLLFNQKKPQKKYSKNVEEKKVLTEEEKKQQAQLSMLTMDEEEEKAHFNLDELLIDKKKNKSKSKKNQDESKKVDDDFKINMEDPRFQAIFTSHKFNIDPSDQSFKKTKAMENLLLEKIKRIENNSLGESMAIEVDPSSKKSEDSLLVKSIKSKTEVLKRKKEESDQKQQKFKMKKI